MPYSTIQTSRCTPIARRTTSAARSQNAKSAVALAATLVATAVMPSLAWPRPAPNWASAFGIISAAGWPSTASHACRLYPTSSDAARSQHSTRARAFDPLTLSVTNSLKKLRSGRESNPHSRICSPLHHHSATGPWVRAVLLRARACGVKGGFATVHAPRLRDPVPSTRSLQPWSAWRRKPARGGGCASRWRLTRPTAARICRTPDGRTAAVSGATRWQRKVRAPRDYGAG